MWLEKRHGKNKKPGKSERLGRKGGRRVQSLIFRRRSKNQDEENSGVMRGREGLENGTLQFEISRVEQQPIQIRARYGSEWGWLEWSEDEGPWD